jgi:O-antigen/teichoic acid export membrane protein
VTLLGLLVLRAGVFFVQRLAGSVALGEYSIASQLAEVIGILPASVALVLFPRLASDLSGSWRLTLRTAAIVGGLLAVTAGVVGAIAEPLIALAYGAAFAGSVAQLRLMLPGVVFFGMLSVLSQFIAAVGMPLSIVWAWAAGFVAIVVLCGWLVPLAGAAGAALAVSITYLVLLVLAFGVGFAHRHASA